MSQNFRKFRKVAKGSIRHITFSTPELSLGDYGIKAMSAARMSEKQLEAIRVTITRVLKPLKGKLFIRLSVSRVITKKAAETRMGGGKGSPDHKVAIIEPGRIMFEMIGVSRAAAYEAYEKASYKIGVFSKFVERLQ